MATSLHDPPSQSLCVRRGYSRFQHRTELDAQSANANLIQELEWRAFDHRHLL
jgi:hypothetical protein